MSIQVVVGGLVREGVSEREESGVLVVRLVINHTHTHTWERENEE